MTAFTCSKCTPDNQDIATYTRKWSFFSFISFPCYQAIVIIDTVRIEGAEIMQAQIFILSKEAEFYLYVKCTLSSMYC